MFLRILYLSDLGITGLMHDAGLEEEEEDDDDEKHAYTTTENTTDDKINMMVDGGSGGLSPPSLSAMKETADHRHSQGSDTKATPTPPSPRRQTNMDINDIFCSSSPTCTHDFVAPKIHLRTSKT